MFEFTIDEHEFFDERTNTFIKVEKQTIQLEHSLFSLSKWEAKWHKPFISKNEKTIEETIDYYRCMTLNGPIDAMAYYLISEDIANQINEYIKNPMTATTFNTRNERHSREIVTAEIVYQWMITHNVPIECERWHLNKLLTLLKVCSIKANANSSKKMNKREILSQNHALNELRKKNLGTNG